MTGIGHQTALLQVGTALQVQFGPMASFAARREPLGATSVWKVFERAVYPSEAQGLFHHVQVWNTICPWLLGAIDRHPAILGRRVVRHEPFAQLRSLRKLQQTSYLHII